MSRALVVLSAAYLLHFASTGIQLPLASPALTALGFPVAAVGLMWAVRSLVMILAPPLWGALADRAGTTRPFARFSLAAGAVLLFLLAFVKTEAQGVLLFAAYGLLAAPAGSLLDGMALTALGDRKRLFGRVRAFGTLGFGASALLFGFLVEEGAVPLSARALFPIAAAFSALAFVALLFAPALPRPRLARPAEALRAFGSRRLALLVVASALLWASHGAYSSFLVPLAQARGAGTSLVGASMFVAIAAEVVAFFWGGAVLARFGGRRVMVAVCAVAVLRWVLLAVTTDAASFVLLQALHGVTFGLSYPTAVTLLAEAMPEEVRQSSQGIFTSLAFGVGGGAGALLSGLVLDGMGAQATWIAMAAVAAAAVAVSSMLDAPSKATARPRA